MSHLYKYGCSISMYPTSFANHPRRLSPFWRMRRASTELADDTGWTSDALDGSARLVGHRSIPGSVDRRPLRGDSVNVHSWPVGLVQFEHELRANTGRSTRVLSRIPRGSDARAGRNPSARSSEGAGRRCPFRSGAPQAASCAGSFMSTMISAHGTQTRPSSSRCTASHSDKAATSACTFL